MSKLDSSISPLDSRYAAKIKPIAKFFSEKTILELIKKCKISDKDSVFFVCNKEKEANNFAGIASHDDALKGDE